MMKLYTKTLLLLATMMLSSVAFAANTTPKTSNDRIIVMHSSNSTVSLRWTAAMDRETLPEDIRYVLKIGDREYTTYGETFAFIDNLASATKYTATLTAYDENGSSVEYKSEDFKTDDRPFSSVAPTLSNAKVTTSRSNKTITLSWDKASDDATPEEYLFYRVMVSEANNASNFWIENIGFDKTSYVITDLKPSTKYDIQLYAIDENNLNAEYTKTSVTTSASSGGINIYILGTRLDTDNMDDVLGDGSVKYNPKFNVLTLTNANLVSEKKGPTTSDAPIFSQISGLTIRIKGECTIKNDNFNAMTISGHHTFTSNYGDDVLNISCSPTKNYCIGSGSTNNNLTFTGHLTIVASQYNQFISSFNNVTFDDCLINAAGDGIFMSKVLNVTYGVGQEYVMHPLEYPYASVVKRNGSYGDNYYYDTNSKDGEMITGPVHVIPTYGFAIDGVCAWIGNETEMRQNYGIVAMSSIGLGIQGDTPPTIDHIYCFKPYSPNSEFAVEVIGSAYIKKMTLSAAKNYIGSYYGQIIMKSDGSDMYAIGTEWIDGNERLVSLQKGLVYTEGHIYGAYGLALEVKDRAALAANATDSGLQWMDDLIMEDGVEIWIPENGQFVSGHVVGSYNKTAKEVFIGTSEAYAEYPVWKEQVITGINPAEQCDNNTSNAAYSIMGTRVGDSYRGIVIRNGKKMLVK